MMFDFSMVKKVNVFLTWFHFLMKQRFSITKAIEY
jgi:hypothetical protein